MLRTILRAVIGVAGALALFVALRLWLVPAFAVLNLGLAAQGALGLASTRADVAGFFAVAGLLAIAGAVRNDARLLTAPLMLVGLALTSRLLTAAMVGLPPETIRPIAIEAVLVVLFGSGRFLLNQTRPR